MSETLEASRARRRAPRGAKKRPPGGKSTGAPVRPGLRGRRARQGQKDDSPWGAILFFIFFALGLYFLFLPDSPRPAPDQAGGSNGALADFARGPQR